MANVFYVSEMNATSASNAPATFGQTAATQDAVTYSAVTTIAKSDLLALSTDTVVGVSTYFSFYLDVVSSPPIFVGVTNNVVAAFPSLDTAADSNSTPAIEKKNITDDFLDLTAKHIFGHTGATAMINNPSTVTGGYDTALGNVNTAVNSVLGNNSSTKTAASDKLVKQIAVNYIERFALMYRAASVASGSAWGGVNAGGLFTADTTHTGCTVTQLNAAGTSASASTTNATIAVKISSTAGEIESLYITSNADQWTSNTGSGYVAGRSISISKTISNALCIVKIPTINAVQAAILNGTLDNSILLSITKDAVLFDTPLNVGTGTNGVALVTGSTFASANDIASVGVAGGASATGSTATFDVIMHATNNTVVSIKINTHATTGSAAATYAAGNTVTLTQGASTIVMTLNTAMANVLNGVADAGYGYFPCPSSATGNTTTGTTADGKTMGVRVTGGSSSADAYVDITMADKYNIETISLNRNVALGFVSGDTVTMSSGTPAQKMTVVLNATTAEILNGTADALSTNGATPAGLIIANNLPLEAGDKIRMQQGVSGASGQTNTKGETITYSQTAYVDYLLG